MKDEKNAENVRNEVSKQVVVGATEKETDDNETWKQEERWPRQRPSWRERIDQKRWELRKAGFYWKRKEQTR